MKIFIASDHAGYESRDYLAQKLSSHAEVFKLDLGKNAESVDYPDVVENMMEAIHLEILSNEELDTGEALGILLCGSGVGVSIAANKYPRIRAALCYNKEVAGLARKHNNANVLCFGARMFKKEEIMEMIEEFLRSKFEGGRHQARIDKILKVSIERSGKK